ncbi:CsxC family protein [Lederbergia lenta]|uniref:Uncharacterized protein n=1 Tax=Lederbergia lenta TaxID=1467 RepID=A0A2X4WSF4_LEDLE|nr:hypothetical protein [Lederbergia lenta]MCM3113463.1 hypothetical protein [Lederbergia lenta]MEC2326703.1 hypothetical protein [Lederbergia lenta]SQI61472.1 Uncharacterised protein [Lederbergia lenta]
MKQNTNCGSGSHKECPPQKACDQVKSNTLFSEAEQFATPGALEETVVLGDVLIQSLTEAHIHLPSYATDIKHIRKNVSLTQCKALPVAGNPNFVKLFVEGYVHKNIQYAEDCNGYLRDYSVNVPFKVYQQVELANPLVFPFGEFSVKNNVLERRELASDGHGADRCNFGSLTFEINNEPVHCKLLASAVNQWDITNNFDNWGRFNEITEKMEVILVIKLSQKQQDPTPVVPTIPPTGAMGFGASSTGNYSQTTIYDRFKGIIGQ